MNFKAILYCLLLLFLAILFQSHTTDWGFFGHKRINKLAVFTLPSDLIGFYKGNIDFITEHAVDPDKRRYSSKFEAIRHYIDIDHWGEAPFDNVPRKWLDCMMVYTDVILVKSNGDSIKVFQNNVDIFRTDSVQTYKKDRISLDDYQRFFVKYVMPTYYDDERKLKSCELLDPYLPDANKTCSEIVFIDRFSAYGILPYHLLKMQHQLRKAFETKNLNRMLRLSAEMGHYLGDAHVPLHTTENYNGQLSNQLGIHAFWESRIPELFADKEYDYFVGQAQYIEDPGSYFWKIVLDSHELLDEVLGNEKRLSEQYAVDQQFCFEDRKENTVKTQCEAYARAYSDSMSGMVEQRMRDAILAIGSCWYTAWVDAGQPDLSEMKNNEEQLVKDQKEKEQTNEAFEKGKIKGRSHDN